MAVLRSAGRSQFATRVVGVGVDGAREIAEGGATLRDGDSTTSGIVCVVELRDDVSGRRVADLQELVVGVVGPGGGQAVRIQQRGL